MQIKDTTKTTLFLISAAFLFGILLRLIWVIKFGDDPSFLFNGSLMLTTNDGYFFASGVDKLLHGNHEFNPRLFDMYDQGMIWVSAALVAVSPFSMDTTLFFMPIFVSSLIVIPVILIGRLYNNLLWGFISALIAVIAWSYYNRTMAGYYDTDMFAIWLPTLSLYFMLKSIEQESWEMLFFASLTLVFYSFVYSSSAAVVYAMSLMYIIYKLIFFRKEEFTYKAMVLLFIGILPFGDLFSPYHLPYGYLLQILILIIVYKILSAKDFSKRSLIVTSAVLFVAFLYFGNIFGIMIGKITGYTSTNVVEGLKFFGVVQTVQEASPIDFITMSNRISGSVYGFLASVIGYIILVKRYRAFILALPLLAIGVFSLIGGLRFTVYATPIAALSAGYIIFYIAEEIRSKLAKKLFMIFGTLALLIPNAMHIIDYDMPTVFTSQEVNDLEKLKSISKNGDYILSWWDYGYPLWYYTGRNTLIDGGKHHHDNFVISQIMLSPSSRFVYNFSSLAVEEYIKLAKTVREANEFGNETDESRVYKKLSYQDSIDVIFKNKQKDEAEPYDVLSAIEDNNFTLPKKTADIYIYMPYRMMDIFPTIASFGYQDLKTGENKNEMQLTSATLEKQEGNIVTLSNGFVIDMHNGTIEAKNQKITLKNIAEIIGSKATIRQFDQDAPYCVVYTQQTGVFYIMDSITYDSAYIQMFLLGKYDKNLFELVVSSPYSKIYKLKR